MSCDKECSSGCDKPDSFGTELVKRMLVFIGENPDRDGLVDTPSRVVRAWGDLFSGYNKKPQDVITNFENDNKYDELVILKNIEFYSTCEHHILPFYGVAHIAYLPSDKIVGISKLARLLDIYTKRLQVQERIGQQVVDAIMEHLNARGAACVIEAKHMCMSCRGVQKQGSSMVTSSLRGECKQNSMLRAEVLSLLGK